MSSDGHDSLDEDEEEEELMELTKIPKLHLRPKTAPAVETRRGARYVTWNEAQKQNGSKRPSSASKPIKHHRDLWSRVWNFMTLFSIPLFHLLKLHVGYFVINYTCSPLGFTDKKPSYKPLWAPPK